jgi:hypothetical protein
MIEPGRLPSGLFYGPPAFHGPTLMPSNSQRHRDQRSSVEAKASGSGSQAASAMSMMVESMVHMVQSARDGSPSSFNERI